MHVQRYLNNKMCVCILFLLTESCTSLISIIEFVAKGYCIFPTAPMLQSSHLF